MRSPRAAILVAALGVALALPSTASGWKFTFQDLALGGGTTSTVEVKKCKGKSPFGIYNYEGNVIAPDIQHTVTGKMPALAKFRDFRNVQVTFTGVQLPPDTLNQLIADVTAFYEATETKFKQKKGKLLFRHPALILFGSEALAAGTETVKFKPKKGC